MDLAGPFFIRKGHTRKPVEVKAYLIVFICFCTKAVHLELLSDMTTAALIAAIERFTSRRGLPLHLHSDNGRNFLGAKNELAEFYKLIHSKEALNAVHSYAFDYHITWHTIPERAPHFGGLWEAAVKAAKFHLKRIVGQHKFELYTIVCKMESYLNSRPLGPITSHRTDGVSPLTPSHFLIGRATRAYPQEKVTFTPTPLQRWALCQQTAQHFWDRWSREYLQQLQRAVKWHKQTRNFQVGDLVLLTDGGVYQCQWTMAKVIAIHPGRDNIVRAVDVQVEQAVIPKGCKTKAQLAQQITKTAVYRRPVCKLSMLLAVDEVPKERASLQGPDQAVDEG